MPLSEAPPFRRAFPLETWFPDSVSPVRRAWERSCREMEEISRRVANFDDPTLAAVAVSGSLGRMEGRDDSDWDVVFLLHSERESTPERFDPDWLRAKGRELWERLDPSGSRRPEAEGIFAQPVALADLADPRRRGKFDESPARFGKRMQLLLDCQTVFGHPTAGVRAALSFYGADEPGDGDEGVYLFNDLVRYHRSLCVMTQWLSVDDEADRRKHFRLKMKLRFTRFLNYLGLLLPLSQAIDRGSVGDSLASYWTLTPLERVLAFASPYGEASARRLCETYEAFLAWLERETSDAMDDDRISLTADEFSASACDLLRAQPFLQRGRAADLLML